MKELEKSLMLYEISYSFLVDKNRHYHLNTTNWFIFLTLGS